MRSPVTHHVILRTRIMYRIELLTFLVIYLVCSVNGASYQRYDSSTRYPNSQSYSTISNLHQYPYKTGTYGGSDIANFPEATRYPNYSPGYSTDGYSSFSTNGYNSMGAYPTSGYNGYGSTSGYNTYSTQRPYQNSYDTQRYGDTGYGNTGYGNTGYGSTGYGNTGYGSTGYGNTGYGTGGYSSYEMPFMRDIREYCINRTPQTRIWVDSLMGMWYGVEFVQHLAGDSRVDYARSCIVIHISEPIERPSTENQLFHVQHINAKFRQEYRHLRLLWDEAGQTIEYALYFRNDSAGYWQVFDGQNGTIPTRPKYQQFSGTVQVLKAVNDHLVLNFCQEPSNERPAQLYSVLFSREPGLMPRWEVEAVHTLLQNKKLSVASRRMVCGNSADMAFYSLFLSSILLTITFIVSS